MEYSNNRSEIIYSNQPENDLTLILKHYAPGKIFLATETTVFDLWIKESTLLKNIPMVILPSGEENKKIENVVKVWEFLANAGADRKSLLINVGGGMLTDLCGFAAATFKRGIDFVNIPTTLLSQVDASVGGKTGINLSGLKNEVGAFCDPRAVIISTQFLRTLDGPNLISGFAEMIKHGLIFSPAHLDELRHVIPEEPDYDALQEYIRHSVEIKEHFVLHDPKEKGIRKALNFGHTVGHAIESLAMEQKRPVLHGYAVAWGMIAELHLSMEVCGLSKHTVIDTAGWITRLYGKFRFDKSDYEPLFRLMQHDKKNEANRINFTLLSSIGQFVINKNCDKALVDASLDFLRDFSI
jgi:3-dehydroquinate synthase